MKYLFLTVIICLLSFCTTQNKHTVDIISVPEPKLVDGWMNAHFELDRIVPIETTKDYILGNVQRVILYKDKLIILDMRWPSIFVLNVNTGKIETYINRKGKGPGESNNICDIAFDDKLEQILAFNDYKKLLYFDLNGNFLKEENIDGLFDNISYNNGNIIFYHLSGGYSCFPHTVRIYNPAKKSWIKLGEEKKVDFPPIRGYGRVLVKSKNIWFSPVLSLDMNMLQGDTIKTLYHLDVKNKLTDEELNLRTISDMLSFRNETRERNILYAIQSIRETEKYLIFNTNLSDFMMMNKNTLELHRAMMMEDEYLGIRLFNYFPHDGDDNRIMFVVTHDEWMRRNPYDGDDMPEKLKAEIEKVKLQQNYENNPILLFYKEK